MNNSVDDQLSFRCFIGLGASDSVSDHSTFSVYRSQLREMQLIEELISEINRQLDMQGEIIRKGTIVDATLVEAAAKKPDQKDNGEAGTSKVDDDAEWVCKGAKRYLGYKAHMCVGSNKGFILKARLTNAKRFIGHELKKYFPINRSVFLLTKPMKARIMTSYSRRKE